MTDSAISDYSVERFIGRRRPVDNATAVAASPRSEPRLKADFAQYRSRPRASVISLTFSIATVVILWIGWRDRNDAGLTPESGIGYWLGIAGSVLMLLLLLYPLRKRMRSLRVIGSVPFWFRAHMILGVFGPVMILWHANFTLGSINSNVALIAMLVVAASGIFGRYLYSKIHVGLYGRKAVVREILADAEALKRVVGASPLVADRVVAQLNDFARFGTFASKGILAGFVLLPVISWRGAVLRMRLVADARRVIALEGKRFGRSRWVRCQQLADVADLVTLHVAAVKKAAAFAFYERLFRLWHVFHVPLFFLLVIAAIIHIFAAHFF
jgi:hypothetical protein